MKMLKMAKIGVRLTPMPHPNRSKSRDKPGANPTPEQITTVRVASGLSRAEAARLIYCGERAWQEWELGNRQMHAAMWELFKIKLHQQT
jgi:DNA-binding transcriptional regulator YiaG